MLFNPRERWAKPELRQHIIDGEEPLAAISAFTGILGHPLVRAMPFMAGSNLWDMLVTDRRILALQRRILFSPAQPETISIPTQDIINWDIIWDWGFVANVRIWTQIAKHEFKIAGAPVDTHAFKQALKRVVPA